MTLSLGDVVDKNEKTESGTTLLLRMPAELKAELQREAAARGRKLTAEVNIRLKESLTLQGGRTGGTAYDKPPLVTVVRTSEPTPDGLSEIDAAMIQVFRRMPPEKQLALLSLFK